jgi:glutamyl-tRNA reductase
VSWLRTQNAVTMMGGIRVGAEIESNEVLQYAEKQLEHGALPEQVLDELARTLTNKLLHEPSRQLRQSGSNVDNNLIEAAKSLFNLKD